MPTAKFEADFTGFVSGVQTADAALGQLDAESAAAAGSLGSVESAAGATAGSLGDVASSASDAGSALAEVGSSGAAGMNAVASATGDAAQAGGIFDSVLEGLIGTFAGLSLERLTEQFVEFGVKVVEAGEKIEHLSAVTGFSTDAIQQWQYVAGQTGTSMDVIARASETLQQRIGAGDKGLIKGLDDLGISLDALKEQSPEEAFKTLLDALKGVENQSRQNADANDAFGRSGRELIAVVKSNYDTMMEQAPKMNEEYTKDLANIEHAWNALKSTVVVEVGSMIGAMTEFSNKADDVLKHIQAWNIWQTASELKTLNTEGLSAAAAGFDALATHIPNVTRSAADLPKPLADITLNAKEQSAVMKELADDHKALVAANEPLARAWEEIRTKTVDYHAALDQLDGTVVESVKSLLDLHVSEKAISEVYELRPEQVHAIAEARKDDIAQMKEQAKADKELVDQEAKGAQQILDEWSKTTDMLNKLTLSSSDYQIAKIQETAEKKKAAFKSNDADQIATFNAAVDQETRLAELQVMMTDKGARAHEAAGHRIVTANTDAATAATQAWDSYVKAMDIIAGLDTTTEAGAKAAAAASTEATDQLNAAMDAAAKQMTVVVGTSASAASGLSSASTAAGGLSSAMTTLTSRLGGGGWASQSTAILGGAGGYTDPRVLNYLSMGYTASEAAAIVSGSGASINIPVGQRLQQLGQAESAGATTINITNNGLMATDKQALNASINDTVMQALKAGRRLPRS